MQKIEKITDFGHTRDRYSQFFSTVQLLNFLANRGPLGRPRQADPDESGQVSADRGGFCEATGC